VSEHRSEERAGNGANGRAERGGVQGAVIIKGARPYGEDAVDLLLTDGRITAIGDHLSAPGADVVDAAGLVALPGLVDLHTHLREPGREDAETVETGSRAAALGGFTAVHAMAITVGLRGERLAELGAMADSAARVRVFSDDGHCVADPALMRRALEYVKAFDGVVAQHAEEPRLTVGAQMNEGERSARLGLGGWPAAAEEAVIARDVLLAGHVGARLHVCHVSTAGSVEILRWAKSRGVQVTAEVTPHHLLLTDECAETYDPVFKVNPPLRTAEDVEALRAGLADGTIDAVGTDHAPHAVEDKESEWAAARPGMLGLEQALSVVLETMVEPGRLDWRGVADRMSVRPAAIGRLGSHGRPLAVGEPANLLLLDPAHRAAVDPAALASRSRNSPYAGRELPGRVVATFLRGVATVLDGKAQR
jgi:dihydroorotase